MTTLSQLVDDFHTAPTKNVQGSQDTYYKDLCFDMDVLGIRNLDVHVLQEDVVSDVLRFLQKKTYEHPDGYSANTQSLHMAAWTRLFWFLFTEKKKYGVPEPNMARVKILARMKRRQGERLPVTYSQIEAVEKVVNYVENATMPKFEGTDFEIKSQQWMFARDRFIILTLADTGLRNFELRKIRFQDITKRWIWVEENGERKHVPQYEIWTIGKGNKEANVRMSSRCYEALEYYTSLRPDRTKPKHYVIEAYSLKHGGVDKPFQNTMLKQSSLNPIIHKWAKLAGAEGVHPHSFRHYFVTLVAKEKNLKVAQELARHKDINMTKRYTHLSDKELDDGYNNIFG